MKSNSRITKRPGIQIPEGDYPVQNAWDLWRDKGSHRPFEKPVYIGRTGQQYPIEGPPPHTLLDPQGGANTNYSIIESREANCQTGTHLQTDTAGPNHDTAIADVKFWCRDKWGVFVLWC